MTDQEWEPHVDRRLRKPKRKAHISKHDETPEAKHVKHLRRRVVEELRNHLHADDLDDDETDY